MWKEEQKIQGGNWQKEDLAQRKARGYSRSWECSHKGTGGREQQANLLCWKEECTGKYNRIRFCMPPLGSNPEDVTTLKYPACWSEWENRNGIAVMLVSRWLPAQWNIFICFHMQSLTADTYLWLGAKRKETLLYLLSCFEAWLYLQGK